MTNRRKFLKTTALGSLFSGTALQACAQADPSSPTQKPVVISTWRFGIQANEAAWKVLSEGGSALDAVEQGVRVVESDPEETSVGIGGLPDREGNVTLDACIMDEKGDCGSVAYLQHIENPISVARKVMEETPHVMLVGDGALQFAKEQGFTEKDLLTDKARKAWEAWKEKNTFETPEINAENHDTIGMIALDQNGNLSGACTTSGAAYKLKGRVGDSPIIGAGMYVDNAVGGAAATGWGEAVIRVVGCHLVVEFMRQGKSPEEACRLATERVIEKNPDYESIQVGFLALNKAGEYGAYCIQSGFNYAVYDPIKGNQLIDANSKL
ncbi:MAG: N(4)-(beta-N-acetylglucosaminyl)-L-asparaginase [Bacteroidota bacterium]